MGDHLTLQRVCVSDPLLFPRGSLSSKSHGILDAGPKAACLCLLGVELLPGEWTL